MLSDGMAVPTLQGGNVTVGIDDDGEVTLQGGTVQVITPDVLTLNGVIHVIDRVLIPPGITLPEADTCAVTANICGLKGGENKYLYCMPDGSKGETKTKCDTEEKILNLKDEDSIVKCGCCETEENPPDECEVPLEAEVSDAAPAEPEMVMAAPEPVAAIEESTVVTEEEDEETTSSSEDDDRRRNLRG